jgi:L-2,4-diaminobutyrate decarboxylase
VSLGDLGGLADLEGAGGLAGTPGALGPLVDVVLDALSRGRDARGGPVPAGGPVAVASLLDGSDPLPESGDASALALVTYALARGSADPADPLCAGHLHCPPLAVAVAAELAVAALNQSLDSWDQAPAASQIESEVIGALARLAGYGRGSAGVMTSGGTESNLMGLLLGRDFAVRRSTGADASAVGVVPGSVRVLCSAAAHFSVQRSAGLLGLGENAVVPVPVDACHRMEVRALAELLGGPALHDPGLAGAGLAGAGLADSAQAGSALAASALVGRAAAVVVATAGTTDAGAIDPLPEIAALARAHGAWLHVDASYGGGALFSDRLRPVLSGLACADSIALDLHKLGWQPVPAGVFLARSAEAFGPLERRVAYLNPADDEDAGYPSLLGRSLRTTRRADAVKLAVTFRALGRRGLGELVDACHDLARYAAGAIEAHTQLELSSNPVLTTVVFRYRGDDEVNARLRRALLKGGKAVVGRTEIAGRVHLKLTLLNPYATPADIDALLALVAAAGEEVS